MKSASPSSDNSIPESDYKTVTSDKYRTVSDILHHSPKVNSVALTYLSLPPYLDSSNKIPHYKNGGNMLLSRNSDHIRLVKDSPKNSGHLFSRVPISQDDLSAFEVELEFQITGDQEKISLIGDGMAIWFTDEQLNQGDVFGMQSNFNGLGIFIDTYKNYNGKRNRHAFPYLSVQRNRADPHFYDKATDGTGTEIGGCSLHRIYNNEESTKLKITYVRDANIFEIDVDVEGNGDWRTCFRKENAMLDELVPAGKPIYLGVSAETGDLHHAVDLYTIDASTFRNKDGSLITEIDSLGEGIRVIDTESSKKVADDKSNGKGNENVDREARRRSRRTLSRLRRQEKKLKELDKIKYGSEHGFVGWFFNGVVYTFKVIFMLILTAIALYACVIGYRVYREKQRKKSPSGLL
ncbi:hypothetical protein PMKS-000729 [Pichia membranifaciens]|uniref:L-type lectin-like domain-containing protein n=1 Tax=Pichia membranifaciens TaxID=4926 RepID=A0A1Q2YCL3_9ASCO|nr:hypothetical protein PMKS-000729 [Pichia membranifaciens]